MAKELKTVCTVSFLVQFNLDIVKINFVKKIDEKKYLLLTEFQFTKVKYRSSCI